MKDDFLGIVSHELRTPLSAILGWARMLKRGMLTSPRARERALEAIERNASLQARLVDDLLDVSRIVSGKLALDMAPVDLAAIIEAAIDSVRPSLLGKGLEIGTNVDAERVTVHGDARRLQQVVWNLLTNAIKFTPPGGRIDIVLERGERTACVSVRDTRHRNPRRRLAQDLRAIQAGRRHRHAPLRRARARPVNRAPRRRVARRPGRGAQRRRGPRRRDGDRASVAETDVPSSTRTGDVESDRARLVGARVLLVDGNDESRELLATALEAEGAELWTVGRVREALETIGSWRPDVIVSDIATHEEEGYAFIREVRALAPDAGGETPAVALTDLARPDDRARALSAGFQTHLPKPVDPRELVRAVARLWPPCREPG